CQVAFPPVIQPVGDHPDGDGRVGIHHPAIEEINMVDVQLGARRRRIGFGSRRIRGFINVVVGRTFFVIEDVDLCLLEIDAGDFVVFPKRLFRFTPKEISPALMSVSFSKGADDFREKSVRVRVSEGK
ncbi:MAG TPA: hypothetical protein PKG48_15905, partial [Bacteroidales bacterium]|nr:hypothetical protein [Bacteroidales bacterium]